MFEKLSLGLRGHDAPAETPEALANTLAAIGATHVQLALKKSFPWISGSESLTPALGKYLRTLFDRHGISVSVLGCYINPVEADETERRNQLNWFKANLKFAKYLGADMVGTETGVYLNQEHTHTEENYQRLLVSMRELTDCAEKLGTVVGIEAVSLHTICSPAMLHRLLEDLNSPAVSLIFDPINLLRRGEKETQHQLIDEYYRLCGEHIALLHLKDYCMNGETPVPLHAGDSRGILDCAYLFDRVLEHSPCIDIILDETPADSFPDAAAKIQALWQEAVQRHRNQQEV